MTTYPRSLAALSTIWLTLACATSAPPPATPGPLPQDAASAPAQRTVTTVPRYSIEDFFNTTRITGASFSPDRRKILISSNETGVFNVYALTVDGDTRTQLTNSTDDAIFSLGYFPNDERLLYSTDAGGNELTHIFVRELDGTVRDLTPGERLKAQFHGWAGDDRSFFVSTNERDPRFFDLYEYDADGYGRTLVFQNDGGFFIGPVSRDERFIALVKPRTTNDSDVFLYDRQAKELKNITAHTGNVSNSPETFTPDSRALLFTTDEGNEFAYLARYDLSTGQKTEVLKPEWDVLGAAYSRAGNYLVVSINNDARTELRLFQAATMRPVPLPRLEGNITGVHFSRDESLMAFYVNDSRTPSDLFVAAVGGEPRRLTRSLNPRIDPAHLVDGEVVRFKSYDGVEIPGILYRPHGVSATNKAPALVRVHGGPGGQARIGYQGLVQYLVNNGYVVYDINNRGSSGYGKTFFAMDDRRHGEADLDDVVASKQMLLETGFVEPDRVGIIGGSYGGYMVLAALAFRPQVFDVGVNIFGVANWLRTLQSIPSWWEAQREALYTELGDPAVDEERLRRISPLFHAANIRKPLIVLQGANDPRVLQVESDEIVEAVRKNGVPVEYIVFPDEGHGFVKRENELRGYKAILDFLERHLKGSGAGPISSAPAPSPVRIDHVMLGVDTLERGIELLRQATGITATYGGAHPGRGTQNALIHLGSGRYLELLAPNPNDTSATARASAQDRARYFGGFRMLTPIGWALQVPDAVEERSRLVARGLPASEVRPGSRARPDGLTLHWRTFSPWGDSWRDVLPFAIEWVRGSPHPASDLPTGCTLDSVAITSTASDSLRQLFDRAGWQVDIKAGAPERLELTLDCPKGRVSFPG